MDDRRVRTLLDEIIARTTELDGLIVRPPEESKVPVFRVKPGDNVAGAFVEAQKTGGTILAQPGAYDTRLVATTRIPGAPLVTFLTDNDSDLPKRGEQITREHAPGLAIFANRTQGAGPTFLTENRARNVAFVNVGFGPTPDVYSGLVQLGGDKRAMTTVDDLPDSFAFDRVLMFGQPDRGQNRGLTCNARGILIEGSGFYDFVAPGKDSQAIVAWNGGIDGIVDNCTLEAGGENFLLGGSDSACAELMPRNWKVRRTLVRKDLAWKTWTNYALLNIKALVELKCAIDVDFDGVMLEHAWAKNWDGGAGYIFKCSDQEKTAPWTVTRNINVTRSVVRDVDRPIQLVGYGDGGGVTERMSNIAFRHVLAYDNRMQGMRMADPPDSVTVDHLTNLTAGNVFLDYWFDQAQPKGKTLAWTNSIMTTGKYGVKGQFANGLMGYAALAGAFDSVDLRGNLLAGIGKYPGNVVVTPEALLANLDADHMLRDGFGVMTTDGKLPGADVAAIREALGAALAARL